MIPTSKQFASAGSSKANAPTVLLAHYHTNLLPIMHPLVSISRKVAATMTTAGSLTSASTLQLPTVSHLDRRDIVKKARNALSSTHTSVRTSRILELASMVTNADWATYIAPLVCGDLLAPHQRDSRPRRTVPKRDLAMLPKTKLGMEELRKPLTSSLNRSISFLSILTSEHAFYRGTVGFPSSAVPTFRT
jgi:hypothetical protein